MKHIVKFLEVKKDNKQLSVDDFDPTARAIRLMKQNLGILSSSEDKKGLADEDKKGLAESMAMQNQMLSMLKKDLYGVYEAEQAGKGELTILYDYPYPIFGYLFSIRLRSQPQNNLLKKISPSFKKEEGWRERLTRRLKKWRSLFQ